MKIIGVIEVHCADCNAYLWSGAASDFPNNDCLIIKCPYVKDPCGQCTGIGKKKE